jgi:hypothetical protein
MPHQSTLSRLDASQEKEDRMIIQEKQWGEWDFIDAPVYSRCRFKGAD